MTESNNIPRHLIATIAYRFSKSIKDIGEEFLSFQPGNGVRTPSEIIFHMCQVLSFCNREIGGIKSEQSDKLIEEEGVRRFFALLKITDDLLKEKEIK